MAVPHAHLLGVVSSRNCSPCSFVCDVIASRACSNNLAPRLTDADITAIKQSREAGERLIRAYGMMLDFYGMELVNARTGE